LTSENEREFVAYCNELLDMCREYNRRYPQALLPTAYYLHKLGEIALDHHGDKDTARRLFREGVESSEEYLRQNSRSLFIRDNACWNAIRLGRLLRDDAASGAIEAPPMFQKALRWAQASPDLSSSLTLRYAAVTAELELGISRYQLQPSEDALSLIQHATAEFRRLSFDFPADAGCVDSARWAQVTLVRQLQRLGRTDDAEEAARDMADWLKEITRRVPNDVEVQKGLQRAQMETIDLLRATNQENEAAPDN
jgi:hypothetical protein